MKKYLIITFITVSFFTYGQKKTNKVKTVSHNFVNVYTESQKEIAKCDKLILKNPTNANAYYNRGVQKYTFLEDYKGAIIDFTKAIKYGYDNDAETFYLRGDAKCKLKDFRGAIYDYDIAIKIDTNRINNLDSENGYEARGSAKIKLNDFENAKSDFTNSIEINPTSNKSYFLRAYCELSLEDQENACSDLSKAGELGHPKAYEMIEKYCN